MTSNYLPEKKPFHASLIVSIIDKVGGLMEVISVIKANNLNMNRIESRPSKTSFWDYDFFVDFIDDENKLKEKMEILSKGNV